ncbi:radical SAM protein [Clostridium felsineum]|uniref:GTP 3',8-cyclase n=1 Tax=Clostridium felsineum TaxID=36839 RepID=A0A1S8LUD2_9CLOT|nr:radical SAM protein [Clostridium felsineum]URZ09327.1 GTP 3',8-cyclase [Clostridium felsineum]URZ14013.1 GTP 3',8-cyclase [Clostridium felsineum]
MNKNIKTNVHGDILVGPHQMSLDITNKCNLRCLHCYNASGENLIINNELTDTEVLDFIDDISKLKLFNFCFCGGEPLLRKDLLIEATKRLKSNGTNMISMVTNATLMDKKTAKNLKDAGVDRIQISVDGARPCTHDKLRNKSGAFEKTLQGIKNLFEIGYDPSFAFTPTSFNIDEFEDVYNLLVSLGAKKGEIRTQPLMLLGRASKNLDTIAPSNLQYRQLVKKIYKINSLKKGPKIQWGDPIDHLIRFRTLVKSNPNICIDNCVILANGDISLSPYIPLVVGNIKKHSIIEYWNKGLPRAWEYTIPRELAKNIVCIADMKKKIPNMPKVIEEKNLFIDLIDDNLNDITFICKKKAI